MERDFMGLNTKDSVVVKEEFVEGGCEDSGFARSSGDPRSLLNKVSALPHFMSLKSEQDEKSSKMKSDLLVSQGYMVNPSSGIFEGMHKRQSGDIQDIKMHPFFMASPFLKTQFMGAFQNFGGSTMKQQVLGGNPHALPSAASVAGATEQWINPKDSGVPAQMTIFYGGAVNVFDDISPEKAQAIMLLAGNGCIPSNMVHSKVHMQGAASKLPAADQAFVNQNMQPCSGLPSPMSVSSHPIDQAANSNDVKASKSVGMSISLVNKGEPAKVMPPIGSMTASAMISSAVPQARKASLARFLEKRKERVMNSAPYNLSNKAADCAAPESKISGVGSCSVSVSKEVSDEI